MTKAFEYVFPAIRGIQAGREYFVSMCPLGLLPKLFLFDEEELGPEFRAQRRLNKGRVPVMARYLLENPDNYAFSAITASLDGDAEFTPANPEEHSSVGTLRVPMSASFILNDGQHRRAAVERALQEDPKLAEETIAVVLYVDKGLERCQQLFADLNRYAVRPTRSLSLLYDHRDDLAQVLKKVVSQNDLFHDLVEMEKSSLSRRSRKLFTFSALHGATESLLMGMDFEAVEDQADLISLFWTTVGNQVKDWVAVRERKMTAAEVRQDFIHSHGIVLKAVGKAGNALIRDAKKDWTDRLVGLREIDWSRANIGQWEGRAMTGGRVSKSGNHVTLTTNVVKEALGLGLTAEERRVEETFRSANEVRPE